MHDAVSGWNDIYIFECGLGPVNEVEPIIIPTVLDRTIFGEGVFFEARMLNREGMVVDMPVICRLDTAEEVSIYSAGGVLQRFAEDFLSARASAS